MLFLLHPVRVSVACAGGVEPQKERVASCRRRQLGHDIGSWDGRGVARVLVRVGDLEQRWVLVVLLLHQL